MADLLTEDAAFSAAHDVCDRCQRVFRLSDGCLCKECGRKHWHDEVCYQAFTRETVRHPWGDRKHTRPGLAAFIFSALHLPSRETIVVGIQRVRGEQAATLWVRDLDRPRVQLIKPAGLTAGIAHDVPIGIRFEAIDPPPWDYLP